jgi:hypothetical protein
MHATVSEMHVKNASTNKLFVYFAQAFYRWYIYTFISLYLVLIDKEYFATRIKRIVDWRRRISYSRGIVSRFFCCCHIASFKPKSWIIENRDKADCLPVPGWIEQFGGKSFQCIIAHAENPPSGDNKSWSFFWSYNGYH